MRFDTACSRVTVPCENADQWNAFADRTEETIKKVRKIIASPYSIINKRRLISMEIKSLHWSLKSSANDGDSLLENSTHYKGAR
jgi:hypothetical protein